MPLLYYSIYSLFTMNQPDPNLLGPIITLRDIKEKGFQVFWNLRGIVHNNCFQKYHVFWNLGLNFSNASSFIKAYYDIIESGEIIGLYRSKSKHSPCQINWIEKIGENLHADYLNQSSIRAEKDVKELKSIISNFGTRKGLIMLNIMFDKKNSSVQSQLDSIKDQIKKFRDLASSYDHIIFNFVTWGPDTFKIGCKLGINELQYQENHQSPSMMNLKKYFNSMRYKFLKVSIQAKDKVCMHSCNNFDWKITDQGHLEKKMFGVICCRFSDFLYFLAYQQRKQMALRFRISLQAQTYRGETMLSNKEMELQTQSQFFKSKSYNESMQKIYNVTQIGQQEFLTSDLIEKDAFIIIFPKKKQV